jgi:flagellar motor protein MotB
MTRTTVLKHLLKPVPSAWARTKPRRTKVTRGFLVAGVIAVAVSGCAPAPAAPTSHLASAMSGPTCGSPSQGKIITILPSGTIHEPQPSLTTSALRLLKDAASSRDASDGEDGKGSVAVVVPADGQDREVLPLTPRRTDCSVEHGLSRGRLIDANIYRVEDTVSHVAAVNPGLDLLDEIDNAVRGQAPGTLLIISNGLSTAGGFDIRKVGFRADPNDLVSQLKERHLLDGLLNGWSVIWIGLGDTAGTAQVPLTKPARDRLTEYWAAIIRAAGGIPTFDQTPLPPLPPLGRAEMPVVPVLGISSATGPGGVVTLTVADDPATPEATFFTPNSAILTPNARQALREIGQRIAAKLVQATIQVITVRGYVADPPESTPTDRVQLSRDRAAAVARFFREDEPSLRDIPIDAEGEGTPVGVTAMTHGVFDELIAASMRKVEISF